MSAGGSGVGGEVLAGWLTPQQAADRLCGVTPRTVRNLIAVGTRTPAGRVRLRAVTLGGRYYTRADWVDEYLAAVTVEPVGVAANRVESPAAQTDRFAAEQDLVRRRLRGR